MSDVRDALERVSASLTQHEAHRPSRPLRDILAALDAVIDGLPAVPVDAEEWLRLYDTVRLMRATVSHVHCEPWPCPVVLVGEALAPILRAYPDRDYPPDLAAILRARFAALRALTAGEQRFIHDSELPSELCHEPNCTDHRPLEGADHAG